jgi:hypothetical protein
MRKSKMESFEYAMEKKLQGRSRKYGKLQVARGGKLQVTSCKLQVASKKLKVWEDTSSKLQVASFRYRCQVMGRGGGFFVMPSFLFLVISLLKKLPIGIESFCDGSLRCRYLLH